MIIYNEEVKNLKTITLVEIANQLERIANAMEKIVK